MKFTSSIFTAALVVLVGGCTSIRRDVESANRKVDTLTSNITEMRVEIDKKLAENAKNVEISRTEEISEYKNLLQCASNSNWMTINALGMVDFATPQLETLVFGHAYTTQEYLGTPDVKTLREATSKNAKLLQSTREELDTAIASQKAEAAARVEAVRIATEETKRLTDERVSIETEALKKLNEVQEERFTWQQKATRFLKEALENAESKAELAKYVLKICIGIAGALVIAGVIGAYFFKSPRFAAYCVGGAGLLFTFGWFFVHIPPWVMVTLLVAVVIAVPAVLIHGYRHGLKVAKEEPPTQE